MQRVKKNFLNILVGLLWAIAAFGGHSYSQWLLLEREGIRSV
jgi:hypothetical protein